MADRITTQNGPITDAATWGGTLPLATETVEIAHACTLDGAAVDYAGMTINDSTGSLVVTGVSELNCNVTCGNATDKLVVEGTLTCGDLDLSAHSNYPYRVAIGGHLTAGTIGRYGRARSARTMGTVVAAEVIGGGNNLVVDPGGIADIAYVQAGMSWPGEALYIHDGGIATVDHLHVGVNQDPGYGIECFGQLTLKRMFVGGNQGPCHGVVCRSTGIVSITGQCSTRKNSGTARAIVQDGGTVNFSGWVSELTPHGSDSSFLAISGGTFTIEKNVYINGNGARVFNQTGGEIIILSPHVKGGSSQAGGDIDFSPAPSANSLTDPGSLLK